MNGRNQILVPKIVAVTVAVICLAVGAAAAARPDLMMLGALGLAATALIFLRPKFFLGLSVVTILFSPAARNATSVSALDWSDELVILSCVFVFTGMRAYMGKPIRQLPGMWWMSLYFMAGLLGAMLHGVGIEAALQGGFLFLKGTILAFAIAQLDWRPSDVRHIARWGAVTIVFVLVVAVVNLAIPEPWAALTSPRRGGVEYRSGLPSLNGPFEHPVSFGHIMALAAIAVVAYRNTIGHGRWSLMLLIGTSLGALLSWRRKAITGILAGAATVWLMLPSRRGSLLLLMLALPLVILIAWDGATALLAYTYQDYVVRADQAPRIIMYRDSVGIAVRDFPLGAGFSRYGSYLAGSNYSPEYIQRGYLAIWGMGIGNEGGFLTDAFWPAILGEAGAVGLTAYAVGLWRMILQGRLLTGPHNSPPTRFLGILLLAWGVEYFIESIAAPAYSAPPGYVLIFALIGIVTACRATREEAETDMPSHLYRGTGW